MVKIPYNKLFQTRFRYSKLFYLLQKLLSYTERDRMLLTSMEFVNACRVEGDYMEFGVYKGQTFKAAYHFAQLRHRDKMRFYAFDSFEGLPKVKGIDKTKYNMYNEGDFGCSTEEFKKILKKNGVSMEKVRLIPGWFNKTLNKKTKKKFNINKAAVIYVDCDLYESAVDILDFIKDVVQDGTVIMFDDWFAFRADPNKGERRAFTEFLKKNRKITVTEFHKFGWHGNSFIIHKKD